MPNKFHSSSEVCNFYNYTPACKRSLPTHREIGNHHQRTSGSWARAHASCPLSVPPHRSSKWGSEVVAALWPARGHIYGNWRWKNRGWISGSCGWNSALECRLQVWASGQFSFSSRPFSLSCKLYQPIHLVQYSKIIKLALLSFNSPFTKKRLWCYSTYPFEEMTIHGVPFLQCVRDS